MSGFQDPLSGLLNWPTLLFLGWLGAIALAMLLIFVGFDSGGFLHRLERRFGIRNIDSPHDDDR